MSDYQQIPGNIRSLLSTKAQTWNDYAIELASQYSALCDETNQRLRRCADYLQRGMWSAAIHLAECQPNLSQAVTWLEFPERSAWADLCVTHGMPAPAILETQCLEALKEAREREKKLQPLLSRHRLLAMAKAPIRSRLEIARLLTAEDPNNPAWNNETPELESARLMEMEAEANAAIQDRSSSSPMATVGVEHASEDLTGFGQVPRSASATADPTQPNFIRQDSVSFEAAIAALRDELTAPGWRRAIPDGLHSKLHNAIARIETSRAQRELPDVAAELRSVFEGDPSNSQLPSLIKRWRELAAMPGVSVPVELDAQIRPILDRHADEQKRQAEIEEVKPFQQLFRRETAEPSRQPWRKIRLMTIAASTSVLVIAVAAAYYYLHFIRK